MTDRKPDNLVALHYQETGSYVVKGQEALAINPLDKWALRKILKLQSDRGRLIEALEQTTSELLDEIRVKYSEEGLKYPSVQRSYRADMAQVEANHKLLKELSGD
ncbi:MAG: hypothetical protein AWU57_423 [Marinobacter sp. T13-3]|nr:MAG: hypothetical protein AWU57_423 [Marinobacter sp. T13-3]